MSELEKSFINNLQISILQSQTNCSIIITSLYSLAKDRLLTKEEDALIEKIKDANSVLGEAYDYFGKQLGED